MTNNQAASYPSTFKYLIVASALFIAGVSAFFSVQGLGYLFAGSATAVMIMAASLEVGKLVAASFLARYWGMTNRVMRIYLVLAVLVLIAITSLGNYGYLARAYERTHTQIGLFESQIASIEKEIGDTQRQIDGARGSVAKVTEASREDIGKLQLRITAGNESLNQALARVQERRKTAQERRDRDLQVPAQRVTEQGEVLKKAIAVEEASIAALNDRLGVLDRAGTPRFTVEEAAIASLNDRLNTLDRGAAPSSPSRKPRSPASMSVWPRWIVPGVPISPLRKPPSQTSTSAWPCWIVPWTLTRRKEGRGSSSWTKSRRARSCVNSRARRARASRRNSPSSARASSSSALRTPSRC